MDFGALNDYFKLVLSKKLSGTDIDRMVSHGHELGGFAKLRPFLGTERRELPARYLYLSDDDYSVASATTTWYDSRANQKNRAPEYRLYYPNVEPVTMAKAGDLTLACLTSDEQILFIFVQSHCKREAYIAWLFGLKDESTTFTPAQDMARRINAFSVNILEILGLEAKLPKVADAHLAKMLEKWPDKFPSGKAFASFARHITGIDPSEDPDLALTEYYNAQTLLYMTYERYERERSLGPLVIDIHEPNYDKILQVAMSLFQRRRSAAGHALEYHLEALFKARKIAFRAQGSTEGKEKPDFIFPSIEKYHDPAFPSEGLTLLGAKTTAKDRWRQVLQEGQRIAVKHLITLEEGITVEQTNAMKSRDLQLIVPKPLHTSYTELQRDWLWTLSDFCEHVLELQSKYYSIP